MVYMHCHCFKYLGKKCYWKWGWRELRQIYCIGSDDLVKKKGNLYSSQGQPCWRSLITWSLPLLAIIALHSLFLPRSTLMPPSIHDTLLLPTGTWGWFDRAGEWFPSFLSHSPPPLPLPSPWASQEQTQWGISIMDQSPWDTPTSHPPSSKHCCSVFRPRRTHTQSGTRISRWAVGSSSVTLRHQRSSLQSKCGIVLFEELEQNI